MEFNKSKKETKQQRDAKRKRAGEAMFLKVKAAGTT